MNIFDMYKLNLQLFADANLHTGGLTDGHSGTGATELTAEMKEYYMPGLLENAMPNLVYAQFGEKKTVPKGSGRKVEWRKISSLPKIHGEELVEGVTPDGQTITIEPITVTVNQYGGYVSLTDRLSVEAIDPLVAAFTKEIGSQAGRTLDSVVRERLLVDPVVMFADKVDADGAATEVMDAASIDNTALLTVDMVYRVAAKLDANNVRPIGDSYVAIAHPNALYDLMRDDEWIDAQKYKNPEKIYNGEVGKIGNVRFVKTTEAKIWGNEGAAGGPNGENFSVYGTLFIGEGAYDTLDISGENLEYIVKPLGSGDDPLNQRSSIGWKATMTAKAIRPENMVWLKHGSKVGPTNKSN